MKKQTDLKPLIQYAKRKGYEVEVRKDHIIARSSQGCIRTASMETLRKVLGSVA